MQDVHTNPVTILSKEAHYYKIVKILFGGTRTSILIQNLFIYSIFALIVIIDRFYHV